MHIFSTTVAISLLLSTSLQFGLQAIQFDHHLMGPRRSKVVVLRSAAASARCEYTRVMLLDQLLNLQDAQLTANRMSLITSRIKKGCPNAASAQGETMRDNNLPSAFDNILETYGDKQTILKDMARAQLKLDRLKSDITNLSNSQAILEKLLLDFRTQLEAIDGLLNADSSQVLKGGGQNDLQGNADPQLKLDPIEISNSIMLQSLPFTRIKAKREQLEAEIRKTEDLVKMLEIIKAAAELRGVKRLRAGVSDDETIEVRPTQVRKSSYNH